MSQNTDKQKLFDRSIAHDSLSDQDTKELKDFLTSEVGLQEEHDSLHDTSAQLSKALQVSLTKVPQGVDDKILQRAKFAMPALAVKSTQSLLPIKLKLLGAAAALIAIILSWHQVSIQSKGTDVKSSNLIAANDAFNVDIDLQISELDEDLESLFGDSSLVLASTAGGESLMDVYGDIDDLDQDLLNLEDSMGDVL